MVVFILERVPATVRGEMSRWLVEPRHGVFIGNISAMVRDRLWTDVTEKVKTGGALLLYSSPNEQGFQARATGDTTRTLHDSDGLLLVHIPTEKAKKKDTLATRVARNQAKIRVSPGGVDEGDTFWDSFNEGQVQEKPVSTSRIRRVSTAPKQWRRNMDHLYFPPDASEIAQHCHDPGKEVEDIVIDVSEVDLASAVIGVRWRSLLITNGADNNAD